MITRPKPPAPDVRGYEAWCLCCGRLIWPKRRAIPRPNICFDCWDIFGQGVQVRAALTLKADVEIVEITIPRKEAEAPFAPLRKRLWHLEDAIRRLYPESANHADKKALVPQAHNIPALLDLIGQLLANAYADGYRDGSALLTRLATGQAGIDDYERLRKE